MVDIILIASHIACFVAGAWVHKRYGGIRNAIHKGIDEVKAKL